MKPRKIDTNRFGELGRIMNRVDPPTYDEERELLRLSKKGDRAATEALICGHLRFAAGMAVARARKDSRLDLEDLMQEAVIGLLIAASKFDLRRKCRFLTYAREWIRARLTLYTINHRDTIRVPVQTRQYASKVMKTVTNKRVRMDDTEAIAKLTGLNTTDVELAAHAASIRVESMDAPRHANRSNPTSKGDHNHHGLVPATSPDPLSCAGTSELNSTLRDMVTNFQPPRANYTPRARYVKVIEMYYGLDGKGGRTLDQIGTEMGVTRERARQMKATVLLKMANNPMAQQLFAEWEVA